MDNQPTTQDNNTIQPPIIPPPTPPAQPSPLPPAPATPPTMPSQPVVPQPVSDISQPISNKKKSRKGLIIGIICALLAIIGGGVATVIIIAKTQPMNIVASAFTNLLNAEHVALDGQINVSSAPMLGDNYANISFSTIRSGSDYSTVATIEASLPAFGIAAPLTLEVSDVIMDDGVLYFKVKGIQDVLSSDNINSLFTSMNGTTNEAIIGIIQNIGTMLENKWVRVSYPEIYSSMMQNADLQISQMDCTRDVLNDISEYSGDLSNTYLNSPFLIMTQQNDSFYDISFDATELANFLNSLPNTKLASDIAGCYNTSINVTPQVSADNLRYFSQYLPNISAKFDGFVDYHLSELKISTKQDNSSYISATADLKFSYTGDTVVTTPTDATSVVEVIQMIVSTINSSDYADIYSQDNCLPGANCNAL